MRALGTEKSSMRRCGVDSFSFVTRQVIIVLSNWAIVKKKYFCFLTSVREKVHIITVRFSFGGGPGIIS
jgi:hypothetical protein